MPTALEEILLSPLLPSHLETIRQTLEAEQARRKRFYDEMTEERKVEFINGEVIVHSPAKDRHTVAVKSLISLMDAYVQRHRLGKVRFEKALVVMPRNDYEPDVIFFSATKAAEIHPDQMKYPPPDLLVEVLCPSTAGNDRGIKFTDYAANGVAEYWIVDPVARAIERYDLKDGAYAAAGVCASGTTITSSILTGFTIPVDSVFDEDRCFECLRALING